MPVTAKIEGVESLQRKLEAQWQKMKDELKKAAVVGYNAPYAVYVHEDLQAHHTNGQAKFLEQPSRTRADDIKHEIQNSLKAGNSVSTALLAGAEMLKVLSQQLVPVRTGDLRDSAFAQLEDV